MTHTNKTRRPDSGGEGAPELWLNRQKLLLPQPRFSAKVSMENLQGRVDAESSVGLTSTPDRAEWWDPREGQWVAAPQGLWPPLRGCPDRSTLPGPHSSPN